MNEQKKKTIDTFLEEYIKIAEARINKYKEQLKLF